MTNYIVVFSKTKLEKNTDVKFVRQYTDSLI